MMRFWRYRTVKEPHLNPVVITEDDSRESMLRKLNSRFILDGGIQELTYGTQQQERRRGTVRS